jgi:DNA polymerase-1
VHLVRDWEDACRFKQWLSQSREFLAFDVETEGLNVARDKIRLTQFGDHTDSWAFAHGDWRGLIKETLETYRGQMVAHNLLFDAKMLKKDGIHVPQHLSHDSMIMTWLKDPSGLVGLKPAAAKYVDKRAKLGQNALGEAFASGRWTWATIPIDHPAYWIYACLDTSLTSMLASTLYQDTVVRYRRAYETELACIHVLRDAEIAGLKTDPDYRRRAAAQLRVEIAALLPQIPIANPGSDAQVRKYLLDRGAPLHVKTENGALSVDKDVLQWLAPSFPICTLIEQYRSKTRMLTNYLEKMDELAVDDVIHASTKPVAARTGRMSVTDPPLQTLPRGRLIRDCFVAREGHAFVMADFAGMEMRALACEAKEENMLAAYARGEDLHNYVATILYGPDFTKPQRTVCKNGGFGKIYGAGAEKFAVTAKITIDAAKEFLHRYAQEFPRVDAYLQEMTNSIMRQTGGDRGKQGYVELIDGRMIPVDGEKPYTAVNYKIQGSCAVVLKEKIVELDSAGLGEFFRLPVHDELIFEVPLDLKEEVRDVVERVMPDRHNFPGITLEIESDIVPRWGTHYAADGFDAYLPTTDSDWYLQEAA